MRKTRTGEDEIDLRENLTIFREDCGGLCNLPRELLQNPLNLLLTRKPHLPHGIVQLDGRKRLHEERCAARRLIVNDTRKIIAIFLFDGNDVALIAHSDNRFLKVFLIRRIVQDCGQAILYTRLRRMKLPRNPAQLGAGILAKVPVLINRILEMTLQCAKNLNRPCHILQERCFRREIAEKILYVPHTAHRTHDGAKFFNLENRSHCCLF